MKVKDFIKLEEDIDTYNDYTTDWGICMCGPIELTEEGEREFADVLEYDVEIYPCGEALVAVNDYEDCEHRSRRAKKFFYAAAGYCSIKDYEKWFKEM